MAEPFFTIGHSTRSLDDFVSLLKPNGVARVVGVRTAPPVWWRRHRRIITDYLLAAGADVFHIVSGDVPEPARMNPEAVLAKEGVRYPAAQRGSFQRLSETAGRGPRARR